MPRLMQQQIREKAKLFRTARRLTLNDEPRGAIQLLDKYLGEIDPTDVDVLLLKGHILDSIHEFDQALTAYRKVLRIEHNNAAALNELGGYYSNIRHDYPKALRYHGRALALIETGRFHRDEEDEFIEACTEKAAALLELNRPMDALRCIVHGLEKYPAAILLGDALQSAQQRYQARRDRKLSKRFRKLKKQIEELR